MKMVFGTIILFFLGCVQPDHLTKNEDQVLIEVGDSIISIPQLNKFIKVNLNHCALRKINYVERDSILAIKTCDTLYFFDKKSLTLESFGIRGKVLPWNDSLIVLNDKTIVYSTTQCAYILDSKYDVIYTEESFKASIDKKISEGGLDGITPFSGASSTVSIHRAEDSMVIFEYEYLVPQEYVNLYYDTLKLR